MMRVKPRVDSNVSGTNTLLEPNRDTDPKWIHEKGRKNGGDITRERERENRRKRKEKDGGVNIGEKFHDSRTGNCEKGEAVGVSLLLSLRNSYLHHPS